MPRIFRTFLFLSVILSACSTGIGSPPPIPPSTTAAIPLATTASPADPVLTVGTPDGEIPSVQPNPQDCGYQWANKDLPELSSSFQTSIQTLQPEAQASAYVFGESCIRSDGSIASFIAR